MQELQSRVLKTEKILWRTLLFVQDEDFKEWNIDGDEKLFNSLLKYQFADPFKVWQDGDKLYCLDGKHRFLDLIKIADAGINVPDLLPATFIDCRDIKEAAELVLIYSSAYARITNEGLLNFMDKFKLTLPDIASTMDLAHFDFEAFEKFMPGNEIEKAVYDKLQEKFIAPPFSVLDTRQGYWQDRKRLWHGLGFKSEETRETVLSSLASANDVQGNSMPTVSIFDPVLTEICYKWFCPAGAEIFDPFAGGSVRGIVASVLGYQYTGIDLRNEQVIANKRQASELKQKGILKEEPIWVNGDSMDMDKLVGDDYDFIFSCPPYHDLEKYSDDPNDLSNMSYKKFVVVYQAIIAKAVAKLKDNRFACFVVADIRDEKGFYRNFLQDTIDAFQHSGQCKLYNEIILVNVAGSLPVRAGRQFSSGRKVGKMHQNILVFYKGDPKKIKTEFPEIEVGELEEFAQV